MKNFFFDFLTTGGKKTALSAGLILSGFGLVILFFPELLRVLAGGAFLAAGIPLILYGLKDGDKPAPPSRPSNPSEDPRIIYPEE